MGRSLGPKRVWMRHENIPGLAMSRSLGDTVAASCGVIAEPGIYLSPPSHSLDVIEYHIAADDKVIIMGSDGVWEFISNEDAIQIVGPYYENRDINGACEALMKEAYS